MKPIKFRHQLKAAGSNSETVTVDPTSTSSRKASFSFDGLPQMIGRNWVYIQAIVLLIRIGVDQPAAAGSIIRADQLYRVLESIKLKNNDMGVVYTEQDLTGASLGLIAQVISNGYKFPAQLREDIAAADGDTAVTLPIRIPLGHKCFFKGHQTAPWAGWYRNGGLLEVNMAASTALAAVSTGAATEATCDVRAYCELTAEPEARVATPWVWRERGTPGGQKRHTIRGVCQGDGIKGAVGVGKLAFLAYLSDQNGLGGADGVDNILQIGISDRDQESQDLGAPFYAPSMFMYEFLSETGHRPIWPPAKGYQYPLALAASANLNGAPNAASALFLPYFWPDPEAEGQQISALQEWGGDFNIEHTYTSTPSGEGRWLTLEGIYLSADQKGNLLERMNISRSEGKLYPKVRGLHDGGDEMGQAQQAAKLRGIPEKVRLG